MIAMEIRELEAFLAVMSAGSITGAARLLDRSQSQVTRLIQDLETSLGFPLFDRNGPRITPSDKGIAFHSEAERFISGIEHLRNRAQRISLKEPEPVEIAATPAFATGMVPLALAELPEALLPHTVFLRSMPAEAAVQAVLGRTADFCVTSLPAEQPGLEAHGYFQGRCAAVLSVHDPLAAKDVISVADLAGQTVITLANPFRLRRRVDKALQEANVRAQRIIATSAAMSAVQIASTGMGIAIVEPATAYGPLTAGVTVRPLDVDIPFLWGIFSATARPLSATAQELIQLIIRVASARMPDFTAHDPGASGRVADVTYGGTVEGDVP
ncbi:LysR family transcriptional regulator [Rhizobium pusense]|uniref:LysR family transcriptional regulator n=1 Tax=Agrobacterium genomosp. 2 str. CFBP 5494 TaxID=1183436 RepID=A0A9W5B609_9HYPH|nr:MULTISPECIES: LysR family transcriptional regulator [Rhizobium/Agrobacterium group]MDH0908617.1 LysR family transcriptional regulator [Agrobacterium pusense]MDH1096202.1 LysR family transcriptional regulator [Agrobacterium pusense]MDH1111043.1 LysR family transcriptional regulator [Agrobacterium pusense]MDH2193246.1 LysR family transcriptional regulator [Agrobacterium pusense]OJH50572.1 LysR family transcriptional regulator [Agrobacterium pusense]